MIGSVRTSFGGVFRTIFRAGLRFIPRTGFIASCGIRWRSPVFAAGFSGRYSPSFEITGPGGRRDGRLALVGGGTQLGIAAGGLNMLHLPGYRTYMVLT